MRHFTSKLTLIPLLFLIGFMANAVSFPPQPNIAQGQYVVDEANLLNPQATSKINAIAKRLYQTQKVPLTVVTINSLNEYGLSKGYLGHYDKILFAHIMSPLNTNQGIMLLVVKNTQQFRIQFDSSYGKKYLSASRKILQNDLLPLWNQHKPSQSIVAATKSLAALVG